MANIVLDFLHNYQTGERRETEPANAYQYDEGHVLEAVLPEAITACEIHYWIRGMEEADAYTPTSITPNSDGSCTVLGNIPNKYFETNGELRIYIVVTDGTASITTYEGKLHICQRSMPDGYVDDDPNNEATRILTEAREAAATATAAAQTAQGVADSIPADYSQMSADISTLKEDYLGIDDRVTALEGGGTGSGLTEDIKAALLQVARKVAYIDADGQDYYDDLYVALYPPAELVSISAVYTQSGTVYNTDDLDSLKSDLVVTALYDDQTSATVTEYTLSGTLSTGTSTITVSYGGKTTTFNVEVSAESLPRDYTRAEYVHFSAGSADGVSTGVTPSKTGNIGIDITFMQTKDRTSNHYFVAAARNMSTTDIGIGVGVQGNNTNVLAFNGILSSIQPNGENSVTNQKISVSAIFTPTSSSITDGTLSDSNSGTGREHGNPIGLWGFYRGDGGGYFNYPATGRIYSLVVTDNDVEIINLIPCVRKSDNKIGFYNAVNGDFITHTGFTTGG